MKDLLLPVLFLVVPSPAFAQAGETEQIERFVAAYEQTWQAHDANQLANFFAADADMIIGIQPRVVGRAAIEASWNRYFSRLDDGRRLSISIESIRILDPDVVLVNVDTTTAGTHSVTSEALEARRARGTWVVTRSGGDWKIAALRAHSPVGQLRETPGTDR